MSKHWIVLVVGIIAASLGFLDAPIYGGRDWSKLAIFLALVARIVQADLHNKAQKQE